MQRWSYLLMQAGVANTGVNAANQRVSFTPILEFDIILHYCDNVACIGVG